ncbi:MAG: beta-ketoacyl-[acyl-carrier-protein] synthase family protein [Betaproteobacteria bacterium]
MSGNFYLPAVGMINALGSGVAEITQRLFSGDTSGMVLEEGWLPSGGARVGRARGVLPEMPEELSVYACRNNGLLLAALSQIRPDVDAAISRYGLGRVGIVLGTSTSGIAEGGAAVAAHRASGVLPPKFDYVQQELGTPAIFLSRLLGITGPAYCVSTACTSSAKAFVSARKLLRHGLCDVVLVGGVDSLSALTINGFSALESISPELCNPLSRNRRGINIGEGAALFLMTREEAPVEFLGAGETSDAYHMSAPHPEGIGAEAAMRAALSDAGITAAEVDYLNMHATATPKNDEMESRAINRLFPEGVATSGTKPMTGHALGAAGATELGLCWLALRAGRLPAHLWDGEADPDLPTLALAGAQQGFARESGRVCMSNSFAFGGSNACLLIGDNRK